MRYAIDRVPFSYFGSWISVSIPAGEKQLYVRNHHMRANNLFSIEAIVDGQRITPQVAQTPAMLTCTAGDGRVEICFEGPDSLRLRGIGVGVLFTGKRIVAYENGDNLAVFNIRKAFRRYQFETLEGTLELLGAYVSEEEDLENLAEHQGGGDFSLLEGLDRDQPAIYVKPDANSGRWELAIDEFWSSWEHPQRASFDDCLLAAENAFGSFYEKFAPVEAAFEETQALAIYVDWASTVSPCGLVKRPTMFMSKNWMNNVWSWDQCFNAMAMAKAHPALAMDQMLTLVDHQDAFGAYTDAFNDMEMHYNYSKPPVHGFTMQELFKTLSVKPAGEVLATMYASLGRQADWWMQFRVLEPAEGAILSYRALPYYLHGNDSGWDNSTMFSQGVPLVSPDLSALLVLQMDALAVLAAELGKEDEALNWQMRADQLFTGLMAELWQNDHFAARLGNTGGVVECQSLIPWLPLILGERLPDDVRNCLKDGMMGHLTEWGLATERVDSPCYIADGYWRGPIWAPSTYLAVVGLARSGYADLANDIGRRFCKLCAKSGFAENFDAVTGEPLRDSAYTWTSSVFLLLAERVRGA